MSLLRISSRIPPLSAATDSYFKEDVVWLHEKNRLAVWDSRSLLARRRCKRR